METHIKEKSGRSMYNQWNQVSLTQIQRVWSFHANHLPILHTTHLFFKSRPYTLISSRFIHVPFLWISTVRSDASGHGSAEVALNRTYPTKEEEKNHHVGKVWFNCSLMIERSLAILQVTTVFLYYLDRHFIYLKIFRSENFFACRLETTIIISTTIIPWIAVRLLH